MPPLDGNGGGAAGAHSHDVVIDVGATSSSSCAVCLEPLEWAAIGPCGHGDVCPGCSLHIRVFRNNRLCCICRSLCRVVVVTKGPLSPRGYRGRGPAVGTRGSRDGWASAGTTPEWGPSSTTSGSTRRRRRRRGWGRCRVEMQTRTLHRRRRRRKLALLLATPMVKDLSSRCAVCLEPLEWAAIGQCGHGDVCPGCALHIRVFQNNRRCCICRSLCRVVVVTNPDAIAAGGWPAVSSRLPRSRTGGGYSQVEGRVGEYWYHAGMEAFFDDERQYAAAKAAARLGPPPPCGDANEDHRPPQVRGTGASNEQQRSRRDPPDEQRVQLQYVEAVLIGLLVVAAVGLLVLTICVLV